MNIINRAKLFNNENTMFKKVNFISTKTTITEQNGKKTTTIEETTTDKDLKLGKKEVDRFNKAMDQISKILDEQFLTKS